MSGVLNFSHRGQAACSWPSHECWTLSVSSSFCAVPHLWVPLIQGQWCLLNVTLHLKLIDSERRFLGWWESRLTPSLPGHTWGRSASPCSDYWFCLNGSWQTPDHELICLEVGESWIKGDITTLVLIPVFRSYPAQIPLVRVQIF